MEEVGELKESWAAERRKDNLIDEQSKCVRGDRQAGGMGDE